MGGDVHVLVAGKGQTVPPSRRKLDGVSKVLHAIPTRSRRSWPKPWKTSWSRCWAITTPWLPRHHRG
jgi:hypothetical protein